MFKKTEEKVNELISEKVKVLKEELSDNIDLYLREILQDTEFLKVVGKALDEAEALRIAEEIQRKKDELTIKEQEMEKSTEPWVEVESLGHDAEKGIQCYSGSFRIRP